MTIIKLRVLSFIHSILFRSPKPNFEITVSLETFDFRQLDVFSYIVFFFQLYELIAYKLYLVDEHIMIHRIFILSRINFCLNQTPNCTRPNTDIKQAMLLSDTLRKQKKFVEYKQQHNHVNYFVRGAKKKYVNDLAGKKADI